MTGFINHAINQTPGLSSLGNKNYGKGTLSVGDGELLKPSNLEDNKENRVC